MKYLNRFPRGPKATIWRMAFAILPVLMISATSAMGPPSATPLRTAVSLPINVMLLFDRSASTIAIEPDSRYQTTMEFEEFGYTAEQDPATDLIYIDGQASAECQPLYTAATSGAEVRCLNLPAGHWYPRHYLDYLFATYESGSDLASPDEHGNVPIPATTIFHRMQAAAVDLVDRLVNIRICLGVFDADPDNPVRIYPCSTDREVLQGVLGNLQVSDTDSLSLAGSYTDIIAHFDGSHDADVETPIEYRCQGNAVVLITDHISEQESPALGEALLNAFTSDLLDHTHLDRAGRHYGSAGANDPYPDGDFPLQNLRSFVIVPDSYRPSFSDVIELGGGTVHDPSDIGALLHDIAGRSRVHRPGNHGTTRPASLAFDQDTAIIYGATADLTNESSELIAYLLTGSSPTARRLWAATDGIADHDSRHILTFRESALVPFTPSSFTLPGDPSSDLIGWVRGDPSFEQRMGGPYRNRTGSLGIIANGHPVSEPAIPNDPFSDPDYLVFQALMSSGGRPAMVYVAANDGMLHGFSGGPDGGQEQFAYIPQLVMHKLGEIADPTLPPTLVMDGNLTVASARIGDPGSGNPWRTLLVGAPGRGSKGLFALDITEPERYRESASAVEHILAWERGDGSSVTGYADMGFQINPPSVIRTRNADQEQFWFVVSGNGVGSSLDRGVVYILDPLNGEAIQTIVLSERSGGVTSVTAVDVNADQFADRLYAADLDGNIWRLDWNQQSEEFTVRRDPVGDPVAVFRATAPAADNRSVPLPQPVTTNLEAGFLIGGGIASLSPHGIMLYFGTGRLLDDLDIPNAESAHPRPIQSLYGILDAEDSVTAGREQLVAKVIEEHTLGNRTVRTVRQLPADSDPATQRGWVIDLPANQERVIEAPTLAYGRVQFTTLAGSSTAADPCTDAPVRYLVEVDAETGRGSPQPLLDLNNDGEIDDSDLTADGEAPAGFEIDERRSDPVPLVLDGGTGPTLNRTMLGPDGEVEHFATPILTVRRAWRHMTQ